FVARADRLILLPRFDPFNRLVRPVRPGTVAISGRRGRFHSLKSGHAADSDPAGEQIVGQQHI
ncbi:MAG: hypothetical protein KAI66_06335, partial [Lentisphaeria bacterium]|nr:hypothetical protein [Lentisphaeria bacterium]